MTKQDLAQIATEQDAVPTNDAEVTAQQVDKNYQSSTHRRLIRPMLKTLVVNAGLRGLLPRAFATWLIKFLGLQNV